MMRLGLYLGYLRKGGANPVRSAVAAEKAGFDSVWVAEAWGADAVSVLGFLGAATERIGLGTSILPIGSRTPALLAQTAATLDHLSGGRFLLGLGVSGPQVMEGWHGVPFRHPGIRLLETVEIVRRALRRETPLTYSGRHHQLPLPGGTGLGKALKPGFPAPVREIPIHLATIGPRNTEIAARIGDGWLPFFFSPERCAAVFGPALEAGRAARERPEPLDVAPLVSAAVGNDIPALRDRMRPNIAFYVGGMGARQKNFYRDLVDGYGFPEEAGRIQDLFLSGRRREAESAVPDQLVDEVSLVGPPGRLAERVAAYREAGVTTLIVSLPPADDGAPDPKDLETLRRICS